MKQQRTPNRRKKTALQHTAAFDTPPSNTAAPTPRRGPDRGRSDPLDDGTGESVAVTALRESGQARATLTGSSPRRLQQPIPRFRPGTVTLHLLGEPGAPDYKLSGSGSPHPFITGFSWGRAVSNSRDRR
jgi:hypothetical protein